jgi:Gpi18-like mannosyltransferase
VVGAVAWRGRAKAQITRARAWWASHGGRNLNILLGVALLARLVLFPIHGFFGDIDAFVAWGHTANAHFWDFYSAEAPLYTLPILPPLTIYLLALLTALYLHFAHAPVFVLYFMIKAAVVLADLATVVLIYLLARRAVTPRWAFIAALTYALSPAIVLVGAAWGQLDSLYTLAVLAACILAVRYRSVATGAVFALAITIKPQPTIFAPLILVYVLRSGGWKQGLRTLAGMLGVAFAIWLPYLIPPRFEILTFYRHTTAGLARDPRSSISAYNLWWMLGLQIHNNSTSIVGPLSANVVGELLFAGVLALATAIVWRDTRPARLFGAVALVALAFFVLTTSQRERYLYPALAPLIVAAIYERKYIVAYVVTTITAFLNMAAFAASTVPTNALVTSGRWMGGFPLLKSVFAWHNSLLWRGFLAWKQLTTGHTEFGAIIGAANVMLLVSLIALFAIALHTHSPSRRELAEDSMPARIPRLARRYA